jgi:DNA-binding NarL/FixJ family response regulator
VRTTLSARFRACRGRLKGRDGGTRRDDDNGVSTAAALRQELPATKVILVTGSEASDAVRRAIEAGCVGYLEKTMALSQLAVAIRAAAAGETAISPEHLALAMRPTPADEAQLTRREREISAPTGGRASSPTRPRTSSPTSPAT